MRSLVANNKPGKKLIAEGGGLAVVINAMFAHPSVLGVQEQVAFIPFFFFFFFFFFFCARFPSLSVAVDQRPHPP